MLPEPGKVAVRDIVNMIADGSASLAIEKCVRSRLSSSDIENMISEYGKTFVHIQTDGDEFLDAVEIINSSPRAWSVRTPLWTIEEGSSDLTLEMTVFVDGSDVEVELDDLRVL